MARDDRSDHRLGWPTGPVDLLAKAVLAPENQARVAWDTWRKAYDINTASWNQVRMLGAIAPRLSWLEPSADIAGRVGGIQKFLWVSGEICLRECAAAFPVLRRAGIPALFLKGVARLAQHPSLVKERMLNDVDVLVPFDMHEAAAEALMKAGWKLDEKHNPWQPYRRNYGSLVSHHAWSYARNGVELDLHHFSNNLNRLAGDDEGLWQRASLVLWRGYNVLVPSQADFLLLALVHGVRSSSEAHADWTVDACAILDTGQVDWQVFVEEAQRRKIAAPISSGLRYLHEELQRPVPEGMMEHLTESLTPEAMQEFECYALKPEPEHKAEHETAFHMAARRAGAHIDDSLPAASQFFPWKRVSFICRNQHEVLIDVPPESITGERLMLRVSITCNEGLNDSLAFTIGIKGLYFFWTDLVLQDRSDGKLDAQTYAVLPRQLLTARGITGLVVRLECPWLAANAGPEFNIEVETLLL